MPGKVLTHPDRDVLSAFGLGKLPPDEAREIEAHITDCEPCCKTLLNFQSDTFVDLVRTSNAGRDWERRDGTASGAGTQEVSQAEPESTTDAAGIPPELVGHPRYRTVELLGRGGMGDVYLAEHRLMNRTVALKVIHPSLLAKPTVVERFRREVQAAAQLSHPNIVTAYDAEQAGDAHFLVMEYVDGTDLAAYVKRHGALPVDVACDFTCQAAAGLQHAHDCGMVHRDIKPHNVMVTSEGRVKILDFGLATLAASGSSELLLESDADSASNPATGTLDSEEPDSGGREFVSPHERLTSVGCTMGTPDFIAPEQASDAQAADARSDIYSLGCTLYFLLTGKAPFSGGSAADKLHAHSRHEPPAVGLVRDDLPAGLADILGRMMAKEPASRFQSAAELADAVKPFGGDRAASSAESTLETDSRTGAERSGAPSYRPAVRWGLAGVVVALAFVAAIAYLGPTTRTTTVRFDIDAPGIAVHCLSRTITAESSGATIAVEPRTPTTFVVARNDRTEAVGRTIELSQGQQVVVRVSREGGEVVVHSDEDALSLLEVPVPAEFRPKAKPEDAPKPAAPGNAVADKSNPNVTESTEYPGVFLSPSTDSPPEVFRSILQLELVVKRGTREPQVDYANGTIVRPDGLMAAVVHAPLSDPHESFVIESATVLMLDGSGAAAQLVAHEPAYGVAFFRAPELDRPHLPLSTTTPLAKRRGTWHTVYKNGPKTYLYTRPLQLDQPKHTIATATDFCLVRDRGSSALSPERSGSPLLGLDGTVMGLMGRQAHWQITGRGTPSSKKLAWAVPAHVITRLIEKINDR